MLGFHGTGTMTGAAGHRVALLLLLLLPAAGDPAPPAGPGSPAECFRRLQEAGRTGAPESLEALLPADLAEPLLGLGERILRKDAKEVLEWRRSLGTLAASAAFLEERTSGTQGVVRCRTSPGEEREFLFAAKDGTWSVASPVAYAVRGKSLEAANGEGPVGLRLAAFAGGKGIGHRTFSFAHVSRDPLDCSSVDLWYCLNGDLHTTHRGDDARIARVAAKGLADVDGLPVGVAWRESLAPEPGGIYVIRCRVARSHDFFVKAVARRADEEMVVLDWEILAAGFGSPSSIRSVHPKPVQAPSPDAVTRCEKQPVRSRPEPAPGSAAPR